MKMKFVKIPASGNFHFTKPLKPKNGLRIDVLIQFIRESSPSDLETSKAYCKQIKKTDYAARRSNDPSKRESAKIALRQLAMDCLNVRERAEVMRYSTLLHTYPYISKATRNGSIEWIAESTRKSALDTREIKIDNKKGMRTIE
jgi:hypothetical protein